MNKRAFLVIFIVVIFLPFARGLDDGLLIKINGIYENMSGHYEINGDVSFVLKDRNIGSAEAKRYPFGNYVIVLDSNKLVDVDGVELEGMLAHELAHLESYSEMSFPGFLLFAIKYGLYSDFQRETERETDMNAIDKGFGKELLAFREYRLNTASEKEIEILKKNYLSIEEIKALIR